MTTEHTPADAATVARADADLIIERGWAQWRFTGSGGEVCASRAIQIAATRHMDSYRPYGRGFADTLITWAKHLEDGAAREVDR